jgi:transketolase
LAALRSIPNLIVIRPGDANEVVQAWKVAIIRRNGPTAMAFSRQNLPVINRNTYASAEGLLKGAYVLADLGDGEPQILLMASGSEVQIILNAAQRLIAKGINTRVVSFPSWELFKQQTKEYQESVLPNKMKKRIAVEAGIELGWEKWLGDEGHFVGMNSYGKSAPYETLYQKFGITVDRVVDLAVKLLGS